MEDLPAELTIDILSRLPVKTIIHCKFVCKKWRNLVLNSSFVDLHLSRSPTGLIIHNKPDRSKHESIDPGILKWLEIEDNVDHHHLNHDPLMSLDLNPAPILQYSWISQMGSVNGLICLWKFGPKGGDTYICNPITREYMILPREGYQWIQGIAIPIPIPTPHSWSITYGFGVGSLTREYKVVRTIQGGKPNGELSVVEAEIYTLGTGQWRNLGHVPYGLTGMYKSYGPFLNGHCHWIVDDDEDTPERLCTFDLDKETFQLFPSPPAEAINEFHDQSLALVDQSLAVLKGCLCQLDTYTSHSTLWVMKEYGIKKSWHKEVVINHRYMDLEGPLEAMSLIEGLKDGSILAISEERLLAIYPRSETIEDKVMFDRTMSGVVYRPSFLKLENFEPERVQMF